MRENMRSSGTGSPPPPPTGTPSGSGESPRFKNHVWAQIQNYNYYYSL
jgi:hypothetical protein